MASLLFREALQHALSTDIPQLLLSAATLGVLSHVSLFHSLPVEYLYGLLGLYTATVVTVTVVYLTATAFSPLQVFLRVRCISAAFNTGLASSIAIYRLFFHRLRRFPGPRLSKLSRFYDAYLAGKGLQYHVEIAEMHKKYGNFFRTGPREICIVRRSAVPLLLSPQSKCGKSTFYAQAQTEAKYCNVHQTRDFEDHRRRRKAWDRGLSVKALATYEPSIRAKANLLILHIEKNRGQAIDAIKWSMLLSFDIMGKVGFGKEFNNLSTGVEHPGNKAIHDHVAILGIINLPGASFSMAEFFKWCENEMVQKHRNWDIKEPPQDITSWLLKAYVQNEISAAPTANALHEDSRAVIILAKLQRLLDEAMPGGSSEWTYDKTKTTSYLDDIINETLRLRPAILTGGYRVTPAEGLQVDEVYIPGDVNVFVPTQLIQTDERYYVDAKRFVPERWGGKKEMIQDGAPYFPFLYGPYVCPGKNLALMSLRISVSKLAQLYDIHFAPGENGELFETRTLDTFTTTLPPLHVQFLRR
ncbi:cytochrome P450 [Aspergillus foveolatus]|uniref:cytochrome P450 n=1 Tax=Aspergillus foveolatus TaxID=210207 RepID=UPI003CCD119E